MRAYIYIHSLIEMIAFMLFLKNFTKKNNLKNKIIVL